MSLIAFAFLLGVSSVFPAAELPVAEIFKGRIADIRGTDGTLVLTMGTGTEARDKTFLIKEARFVGPWGAEWKVGDLREGDLVEVELSADGKTVLEVRVLPDREER